MLADMRRVVLRIICAGDNTVGRLPSVVFALRVLVPYYRIVVRVSTTTVDVVYTLAHF